VSQERAEAVKAYLVGRGIDGSRLIAKGYGDTQPIDSNKTKEGRARNRRVEFVVHNRAATELRDSHIAIFEAVRFGPNDALLKLQSHYVLRAVAAVMKATPQLKRVEVGGHCSDAGSSEEKNAAELKLSRERAETVVAFLVGEGVEVERLSAVGYGDTQPIASNLTKEGRVQNRRVEFKILERA
jgi:outer membrane protein OmpA-like peptidoglycan-associated protein